MTVLLDTHVLLWALLEPDRLSAQALAAIETPDNTLCVSSASAWEIGTKFRLGRLPQAESVVQGFEQHLETLRASELRISIRHAITAGRLEGAHRDPFDRMLAAQAIVEGIPLVTSDSAFRDFPVTLVW